MAINPLLAAADKPEAVLELLKNDPKLADQQDESGYSLLHAAASYGHLQLLRALVSDYHVDVNLLDEDHETCLFVAETVKVARCLLEELHIDVSIRNNQGQEAIERIEADGECPEVVDYLRAQLGVPQDQRTPDERFPHAVPLTFTMVDGSETERTAVVDDAFKERIDQLVESGNLQSQQGQQEFRDLVADAVRSHVTDPSSDRRRRKIP